MVRRSSRLSQQPESAASPAGAAVSPARRAPNSARPSGPDIDSVSAAPGSELVDVGADFFTASELASLALPGLPARREHISRVASRQGWPSQTRAGKGGGREFPLSALPAQARGEILRRRFKAASSGAEAAAEPRELDGLKARQTERLVARRLLLQAFDDSGLTQQAFVETCRLGLVTLPDWAKPRVSRMSVRSLKRWLSAHRAGGNRALAGGGDAGRPSILARSPEASDWILGAKLHQPQLSHAQLCELLGVEFPEGVPDAAGVLMPRPGARAIGRFLDRWTADALNRQAMVALTDPDKWKSHYRFAGGDAAAGIERPNQRWQIDASPADVLCRDGRHSIYVVIDIYTRRMMALVTRTPRTVASLLLVKRACEAWGVPEVLVTDNGSDFVSHHFVDATLRLGIVRKPSPPYSPEKKAFIERGIGTIQHRFMTMMDGFIGHDVADRSRIEKRRAFAERLGETDENLFAVSLSSAELHARLDAWLANVYARTPHRGLGGATPELRALQAADRHPPRLANPAAIGMLLMPPPSDGPTRVVTKKGVAVGGLDYWCEGLLVGQRLQVRLDPADLGQVYLYTDTNPWGFVGIGVNPEVAGIDRAALASRVRAAQDEALREHRARHRRLQRQTNLSAVVTRLVGTTAPLPPPANAGTHETPDLVEAAIAAAADAARPRQAPAPTTAEEQQEHAAFVADFNRAREQRQLEETAEARYARFKQLHNAIAAGSEISDESRRWLETYATSGECKSLALMEESFGGSPPKT